MQRVRPGILEPAHKMKTVARILAVLALLGITAFCLFGFMATDEYPEAAKRLPWQIGYAAMGLACLVGIAAILRPRRPDIQSGSRTAGGDASAND